MILYKYFHFQVTNYYKSSNVNSPYIIVKQIWIRCSWDLKKNILKNSLTSESYCIIDQYNHLSFLKFEMFFLYPSIPTNQKVDFCHAGVDTILVISCMVLFISDVPILSLKPFSNLFTSFSKSNLQYQLIFSTYLSGQICLSTYRRSL